MQAENGVGSATEPIHLDSETDLETLVGEHDVVLVDFYADWCGPCRMLEPILDGIATNTAATVLKVDVDRHQSLAASYGVRGVPTLLLFADGEPVDRMVGVQSQEQLEAAIESHSPR